MNVWLLAIQGLTTLRGYFNTSSVANLSKDSTIFLNLQMETMTVLLQQFRWGKKYFNKFSWKTNQVRFAQCLTMIKNSLKRIRVILKTKYLTNTATMELLTDCHNHAMDSPCKNCYYFKRMSEFVDYIRRKKQ